MRIDLVLGCWGRESDGLQICGAVSNIILDLTNHSKRNTDISNYLDTNFQLYDRPLYNNIHSAIFNIQDKFSEAGNPVFAFKYFKNMEEFCLHHSHCGLYLKLEAKE